MKLVIPAGNAIRILTVDHRVFREGLAAVPATQADMDLVAQTSNGREAIQQFRQHRVDRRSAPEEPNHLPVTILSRHNGRHLSNVCDMTR